MSISLTSKATNKILNIIQDEGDETFVFRIFVTGGGCSGFQYGFTLDINQEDDDYIQKDQKITIVIDSLSFPYLDGAKIDYIEDLSGSSFKVENPNAQSSCGCGTSFTI
jgi:iron-sulfur cluster insertion protein